MEASVTLLEATTPVKLPAMQCPPPTRGLGPKQPEGRISTAAPHPLARASQSLRPILHTGCPGAMQSCSKGSRGLFVPLRVIGIFTDSTISPGSQPRQWEDRCTIRAGRNLPDKEFRYLRTVIVTAAVYRGFNSRLPSGTGQVSGLILRLSTSQSPVFLLNSRLPHSSAASPSPG